MLGLSLCIRLALPCRACGYPEGHDPNCPVQAVECLRLRQKHLGCPVCGRRKVDRNDDDLWECRACHAQFVGLVQGVPPPVTTIGGENLVILDEAADEAHSVSLVTKKGTGKFAIDRAIGEFNRQIRKLYRGQKQ